jgi:hypothetical protein
MAQVTPKAAINAVKPSAPTAYTVEKGDYLTKIAQEYCPSAADWTGLYESNKGVIGSNPDEIVQGERLVLDCHLAEVTAVYRQPSWWHSHHLNHLNRLARYNRPAQEPSAPPTAGQAPVQHSDTTVSTAGDSSFQRCVIQRESGGNTQVTNASGHWGLYQFSESTWEAYGGSAADFGHAGADVQNQVFANAMAQGGESNWSLYDGC